jgi:hypothetical protein
MTQNCDIQTIFLILKNHSNLKHAGKYGPLDKKYQNKLNLKLALYDMVNNSTLEKKQLIEHIIKENDKFFSKKNELNIENDFLVDTVIDFENISAEIKFFFKRVDALYMRRTLQLRRILLDNDQEYNIALKGIKEVFFRHIRKALELVKEKI